LHRDARFALLINPGNPQSQSVIADVQAAASAAGQQLEILTATTKRDLGSAFGDAVQKRADALLIGADPLFTNRPVQLATLAARHAMPTIYAVREFAEAGGLMSYGSSYADLFRYAGTYTGRVLKGEKPADLPILLATKFEFVINLNTAKALGLEIPPTLLALADEVIE
jgi:putative ABC transport system substrate-binding protein